MIKKGTFLLLTLFYIGLFAPAVGICADSAELMPPIQISDALSGIPITKHVRFLVEDIRLGDRSVKSLFSISGSNTVSEDEYISWKEETITIKLKEERLLARLSFMILTTEQPYLTVQLVDPREGGLVRWVRENVYFFLGPGFSRQKKYPIVVDVSPCDRVTQIIFHGIDSLLQREITKAGKAEGSLSLDQLFLLLRKDGLDAFMEKLGPIDPACPAFRLLRWIRNEEVHGFDYEEYSVKPELGEVLNAFAKSVARFQKWSRYNFRISLVGYTDPDPVKAKEKSKFYLVPEETGVKSLASKPSLKIFHRGCLGDQLVKGAPEYLNFFSSEGLVVRSPIENNCELGAVRAYAATAFLVERLGRKNIQYEYATGGVSPSGDYDALKRKVDLKIVVKAATNHMPAQAN